MCKIVPPVEAIVVDKNIPKNEKTIAIAAAAAAAAIQLQQVTNAKRVIDRDRINAAISEIRDTLKVKPKGLSGLKKMCLSLRDSVLTVSDLNTPKARYIMLLNYFFALSIWGLSN